MKSNRLHARSPLSLLLALGLVLPAAAARAGSGGDGIEESPAAVPASLAAALEAVRTDSICADLHFIASDELEGRYTPSDGLRIAARFLRARLQRLGFEPGAVDGYFHTYPLQQTRLDDAACGLAVEAGAGDFRLKLGQDYFYRWASFGEDSDLAGPIVFCGEGDEEQLEEVDVDGAWALILDDGEQTGRARSRSRRSGAIGTLFVPTAGYQGESYAERYGPALERAREGSTTYSRGGDSRGRMRMQPMVYLTREAGLRLLALAPGRPEGAAGDWTPPLGTRFGALTEERRVAGGDDPVLVENVCGFWRGSDPELWKETIVVSAHYDHTGVQNDEIQNGADDNGSGTTGLLAVAEALKSYGPLRRSVLLIWVSGEERGLWGSHAWCQDPWLPDGARPVANLNIDMIGRNEPGELYITPTKEHEKHNFIVRTAQSLSPLEGFQELGSADEFYHRSDQANFATLEIPVAFLFSGLHADYHQPGDDPEKVDCDKVRRVARLVVRLLAALQTDELGG